MNSDLGVLLFTSTVVSSIALVIVLLLRRAVRATFGARVAYGLWSLVPLSMIAALMPAPVHPAAISMLAVVRATALPVLVDATASWPANTAWLAIWMLGTVTMAVGIGWQHRRFVRALGPLRVANDGCFHAAVSEGLPALVGVVRPRIVLPADFAARFDAIQQRLVIAHEREHLRRGDHVANLLATIWRCLHWFNPLPVWALPIFLHDQELACDAGVIAAYPRERRLYGEALLTAACQRTHLPLGCRAFGSHPLKERIVMIQQHTLSKSRVRIGWIAVAVIAAMVTAAAWAVQPPAASTTNPVNDSGASEMVSFRTQVPPHYPAQSLQAKEEGLVVLKVRVLADGTPGEVAIEKSTATLALDQAAVDAVKQWRFNPAVQDGKATDGWVLVPIRFSMDDDAPSDQATDPDADPAPAADGTMG